jgi:two-component sensor histidine kinase
MADLSDNQRVPDSVQNAFDAVLAFQLPNPENSTFREQIRAAAEGESCSLATFLLLTEELTDGMRSACVSPIVNELSEFNQKSADFDRTIRVHLPTVDIDKLKNINSQIANTELAKAQAPVKIEEEYTQQVHAYIPAKTAKDDAETKYNDALANNNGIQAQDFPRIPYAFILITIGAVEWMINYESFYAFYPVPAMAGGFTFAVALAVACASHWHGKGLKAQDHYFGLATLSTDKSREIRAIVIVTIALLIAITYVGYARYSAAMKLIGTFNNTGNSIISSVNLPQINIGQDVTASLAANLLVWFVGAALAYMVHDKDPDYTTILRQKKSAAKKYDQHRIVINKQIVQRQAQLNNQIQEFKNTAQVLKRQSQPIGDWLDTVSEKTHKNYEDANLLVNRLIQNYRTALCNLAAVNNPGLQFNHGGRLINLDAYRKIAINYRLRTNLEE